MNENENLVPETGAENAEHTAEQTPKTYTEAEFNAKLDEVLSKKIARNEAKLRKEYDRRYGDLETVLKAGMGKEDMGEITEDLRKFYISKGAKIEKKPEYSEQDIETLARADANEIIRMGDEEAVEEFERLEALGARMSKRDQATFKLLAEHLQNAKTTRELTDIGVTEDIYNSAEFKEFRKMFDPKTPIKKVYETYEKTLPKKDIKPMGSMKTTESTDNGVKDYYSPEEARKFTRKQLDENPALFKAVCDSMPKWGKK